MNNHSPLLPRKQGNGRRQPKQKEIPQGPKIHAASR
jgi:hypothetical protein